MARRFQYALSEGTSTEIINNEQRLLAGFEDTFYVLRDDLIAGKTTFHEIAEGNVDYCIANPEMCDTWDETEQDGPLPYVDDRDRAVALVLGAADEVAKGDDSFLYQYASARDLFDHVGEDVDVEGERFPVALRIAMIEGDWFLLENWEHSTTASIYESRHEALAAHRERVEELDPFHLVVRLSDDNENLFYWNGAKARERLESLNSEGGNNFVFYSIPIRDLTEGWGSNVEIEDEDLSAAAPSPLQ